MIEVESDPQAADDAVAATRIEISNIVKSFGKRRILDDLSWSIPSAAVVGLLGVNGSGKSTLIRCILGLLKPSAGQIKIDGEDVWDLSDEIKSRIGYVDQHPKLYPWMRGKHLLKYIGSFYPHWNDVLVNELADRWDVPLNQTFGSLSPGQQHKVAILAALGNGPDLLVLDEPVSSLDPLARREFLKSLLEIVAEKRQTVLFSTHITSDLERVASHVAILSGGKIRWFDELDEIKDRVKRLRLRAVDRLPSDLQIPDAVSLSITDNVATAVVERWNDEVAEQLRRRYDVEVAVEDLNLEEIFLELHDEESSDEA